MLFVVMGGFNETGLPEAFWGFMQPAFLPLDSVWATCLYSLFILVASNLFSNVPLPTDHPDGGQPGEGRQPRYLLAFVSTIAGNLTGAA
ncbi:hypothetical protein PAPYR_1746 [Paratrimastix pyriformis]|uniref:Uncharacterized protein n=1 Tax=Paratrimastix pyriformis TaxID=342808 RepID=A0ABQ8UR74_9EUKA|nr:hypothetical protein PAPYR_1746 [Paratrimastix pyriformis]